MRANHRIIGLGLALTAGLLLVSGIAWAQASKTPVSGEIISVTQIDPGESWLDGDGVLHGRNQTNSALFRGDIDGHRVVVVDYSSDPLTGETQVRGFFSFAGLVLEDLVTATGRVRAKCNEIEGRNHCVGDSVWHLSDGGLLKMTTSWIAGEFPRDYVGIIHDNPGGN